MQLLWQRLVILVNLTYVNFQINVNTSFLPHSDNLELFKLKVFLYLLINMIKTFANRLQSKLIFILQFPPIPPRITSNHHDLLDNNISEAFEKCYVSSWLPNLNCSTTTIHNALSHPCCAHFSCLHRNSFITLITEVIGWKATTNRRLLIISHTYSV